MKLQGGQYPKRGAAGLEKTQYGANPQMGTRDNMITNAMVGKGQISPSKREVPKKLQVTLNPQQIRAIKNAPKGVLPAFLNKVTKSGGALGKVVKKGYRGAAKAQGEK